MKTVYLQIWDTTGGRATVGIDAVESSLEEAVADCRSLMRGEYSGAWCDLIRLDDEGYHFIKTFRPMSAKHDDEDTVEYV